MIVVIKGWLDPVFPENAGQAAKLIVDTVVAVALSALSFIAANAVERDSPGLAALFRVIPLGISLVWIFRRFDCEPGAGGHVHHHHVAPAPVHHHHVAYAPPPPKPYINFAWFPFWNSQPKVVVHPAPVHHYAPQVPVYQSPYQPAPPAPVYQSPHPVIVTKPPVYHYQTQSHVPQQAQTTYSAAPTQPVYHHQTHSHAPQQAQTTYSVAQQTINTKSHAPAPVHYAQQPAQHGNGFPQVIKAPAQPGGGVHSFHQAPPPPQSMAGAKPMFAAAVHR